MTDTAEALNNPNFKVISASLMNAENDTQLFGAIVDTPFQDKLHATMMGLGVVVLLIVNKNEKTIDRVALSNTEHAAGAVDASVVPFSKIKIPLASRSNYIAKAIRTGKPQHTSDWQYLFIPALTPEEARLNQAGAAIACSFIYPLSGAREGGAMIFSFYTSLNEISADHRSFMLEYSKIASQALGHGKS